MMTSTAAAAAAFIQAPLVASRGCGGCGGGASAAAAGALGDGRPARRPARRARVEVAVGTGNGGGERARRAAPAAAGEAASAAAGGRKNGGHRLGTPEGPDNGTLLRGLPSAAAARLGDTQFGNDEEFIDNSGNRNRSDGGSAINSPSVDDDGAVVVVVGKAAKNAARTRNAVEVASSPSSPSLSRPRAVEEAATAIQGGGRPEVPSSYLAASSSAESASATDEPVKFRVGLPHTPETRRKISDANRGNVPWNKGKKHSMETRMKIAESTRLAMSRPETRLRLKQVATGRKHSIQTRVRIANTCAMNKASALEAAASSADDGDPEILPFVPSAKQQKRRRAPFAYLPGVIAEVNGAIHARMSKVPALISDEEQAAKAKEKRVMSRETRAKLSARIKEMWTDPDYRRRVANGLQQNLAKNGGRRQPLTEVHRQRIRETLLRRHAERRGISYEEVQRRAAADQERRKEARAHRRGKAGRRSASSSDTDDPMGLSMRSYLDMTPEERAKSRAEQADIDALLDENEVKSELAMKRRMLRMQRLKMEAERQAEIERLQSQWLLQSLASAGQLPPLDDGIDGVAPATTSVGTAVDVSQSHQNEFGDDDLASLDPLFPLSFDIYASSPRAKLDEVDEDDLCADDGSVRYMQGNGMNITDEVMVPSFGDSIGGVAGSTELPSLRSPDEFGDFLPDLDNSGDKHPMQEALRYPGLIADEIEVINRRSPLSGAAVRAGLASEDDEMDEVDYDRDDEDDDDYGDEEDSGDADGPEDVAFSSSGRKSSSKSWSEHATFSKSGERKRLVTYVNGKAQYVEVQ